MAAVNRKLAGIETTFLMADEKMSYLSSSLIRDVSLALVDDEHETAQQQIDIF